MSDTIKRCFDILVSCIALILLAPGLVFIVVRIKLDSPGPVFYRGRRAGRGGRPFSILKFRTMYERPESYQGSRVTAQDDPRVTPVGRWLRDTKLNELPQLWNVLKGEMSLVGPRPEDPEIVAGWPVEVRREVLAVRPGITSPASVMYRNEENLLNGQPVMEAYMSEILPSKLRLDQLYVRHRSFWGDLDVIFWTLLVVLSKPGSQPAEKGLLLGPINKLMGHYVNWFVIDLLATLLAMGVTGMFFRTLGPLNVGWAAAIALACGFALLFSLVNVLLGVNRVDWLHAAASDVFDLLPGATLATSIALLFNYYYPASMMAIFYEGEIPEWLTRPLLPMAMILLASGLASFGFIALRYRTRLVTGLATRWVAWSGAASGTQERVLIVGGGETGQFAAWILSRGAYLRTFRVVGLVDDDLYKLGSRIQGVKVLGQREDIPQLVSRQDVGIIIFAIHNINAAERQELIEICTRTPARLVVFPNIPAALSDLARQNGLSRHGNAEAEHPNGSSLEALPCSLCLTKASPLKVDAWLAQLEKTAVSGNMEEILAQIRWMRKRAHSEVASDAPRQVEEI